MARCAVVLGFLALASLPCVEAVTLRGALETNMQPELVAKTLKHVEDNWKDDAATFIRCNATSNNAVEECRDMSDAFSKSCTVVVSAVVQGSSGDERIAQEYMTNICGQSLLKGWHQQHCLGLKAALDKAMTADNYENRNSFTSEKLCNTFWGQFLQQEKNRFIREEAERKEAKKKAEEEAAKKAEEAAQQEKKAKEEQAKLEKQAKELAEKRAAAEAARKKIEEAKRVKEEAKAKAAKAAEQLAKKKAEAEEFAKKAKQKMEEAAEAEREHKSAMANVTSHENMTAPIESEEQVVALSNNTAAETKSAATKKHEVAAKEIVEKSKTVPVTKATAVESAAKPKKAVTNSTSKPSVAGESAKKESKAVSKK